MSDWLMKVIKAEAERLIALAAEDDELRADLRALAEAILAATERFDIKADDARRIRHAQAYAASEPVHEAAGNRLQADDRARMSRSGSSRWEGLRHQREIIDPLSAAMFRLKTTHDRSRGDRSPLPRKAEAARWAAERLRRVREGNDFPIENAPMDPEMVEWADGLTDCFYWVKSSEATAQADLSLLDNVGGCFETVAEALALVRAMLEKHPGNQKVLERSLPLVAEAQSAPAGLRSNVWALPTIRISWRSSNG